jgi:hypothetical protein
MHVMSESKFFKTHMRSNNTSCEVYNYFMFAVCFKIVLLIPTSLHQKCIITEPKLFIHQEKHIKNSFFCEVSL